MVLVLLLVSMRMLVRVVRLHMVLVLHVHGEWVLLGRREVAVLHRRVWAHAGLFSAFRSGQE